MFWVVWYDVTSYGIKTLLNDNNDEKVGLTGVSACCAISFQCLRHIHLGLATSYSV